MTKKLSDQNLLKKILIARKHEKTYTLEILSYLEEIDKRKLYVETNCSSLYLYCVNILKYSEREAAIRVNATRLIKAEPIARRQVESGKLSLTNASEIQSFFQQEKPHKEVKKKILQESCGKSKRETQKIIQEFTTKPQKFLKLILNERLMNKVIKVQDNLNIDSELQLIETLLDQKILEFKLYTKSRAQRGSKSQRYIPKLIKKEIYENADYKCESCKSYKNLQIDHIRPISQGGNSSKENLQLLCFACNQRRFIKARSQFPTCETLQYPKRSNSLPKQLM